MSARRPGKRVWAAALLPMLPVALALAMWPEPRGDDVVSLAGEWRLTLIEPVSKLKSGEHTMTVPGRFFADTGARVMEVEIARDVDVPAHLVGKDLFFMVPNIRAAFARVYFNERLLGEKGILDSDTSLDVGRLDGFTVPADVVRAHSVVRLHLRYPGPGSALPDGRFLLGTSGVVKTYLERNVTVKHLLEYGALLVSLLGAGLLLYLLTLRPLDTAKDGAEDRALYRGALYVMLSTVAYLAGKTGVVIGFVFSSADVNAFITYTIIGIGAATPELVESYYLRRTTRFRWLNRGVCALAIALSLVLDIARVYPTYSLWLFVVIVHAIVFAVRDLVRPQTAYGPVLASAIAITAVTAAVDLLSDLDLVWTPRLFSFGVANLGMIAACIVLGDFLRLSRRAQALSATLASQNAALTTALAAAEESARVKGEFLANTSHELRTPLNAIINIPQALLEQMPLRDCATCKACGAIFDLDEDAPAELPPCAQCDAPGLVRERKRAVPADGDVLATRLNAVMTSGQHLLGVVNDILDVSKLAALEQKGERFALNLESVPVVDVVISAVDTLEPIAAQAGVRVAVAPIDRALTVSADRVRLAQVLINLVGNALKFSARGGVVHVDASPLADVAGWVAIRVRDEGEGIAPEHHSLIFEAFRQVEGGHTRKHGGTGLGLAIAKKLVELHGGTIEVQSAKGAGATFTVALPVAK